MDTVCLGVLIYEAENTLIFAGVLFIHKGSLKIKADIVILALPDGYRIFLIRAGKLDLNQALGQIESVVENIVYFITVYGHKYIARTHARPKGCAADRYVCNFYHLLPPESLLVFFFLSSSIDSVIPCSTIYAVASGEPLRCAASIRRTDLSLSKSVPSPSTKQRA